MMWYWGSGYGWGMWLFGALMMLVFWGGLFGLILYIANRFGRATPASPDSALEALKRRLASGEITTEEFEQVRKVLQG